MFICGWVSYASREEPRLKSLAHWAGVELFTVGFML